MGKETPAIFDGLPDDRQRAWSSICFETIWHWIDNEPDIRHTQTTIDEARATFEYHAFFHPDGAVLQLRIADEASALCSWLEEAITRLKHEGQPGS
jgi:hypothetical protein